VRENGNSFLTARTEWRRTRMERDYN